VQKDKDEGGRLATAKSRDPKKAKEHEMHWEQQGLLKVLEKRKRGNVRGSSNRRQGNHRHKQSSGTQLKKIAGGGKVQWDLESESLSNRAGKTRRKTQTREAAGERTASSS